MSKLHVLCLGLLVLASGDARSAAQQLPPPRRPAVLLTEPSQTDFGKFEGHGKLVYQELDPLWLDTLVYFAHGSTRGIALHHNVSAMNVFLAAEIRRPDTVRTFIKEHLVLFLLSNLGDYGYVIIEHHWAEGDAKRQRYVLPEPWQPVVAGNQWKVEANVLTWDGAVQHWLVQGQVKPLRIDSFLCEAKEPSGTFPGTMLIR